MIELQTPENALRRPSYGRLELVPCGVKAARRLVRQLHRHNAAAPPGWLFGVGLECDGVLVGVAMVGRPSAPGLQDGRTVEITRVATNGTRNANSMLYGAVCRMAAAGGYRRAVTYTVEGESGSSLRAAGFEIDAADLKARDWARESGRQGKYDENLLGESVSTPGRKTRWRRSL